MPNIPSLRQEKISTLQTAWTVASTVYAVSIVSLPRTIAEKTQTPDVWQGLMLASILGLGAVFVNVKLCQRYPGKTFFEISTSIVGKWIGKFINVVFIAYCLLVCALVSRWMGEFIKVLALERTPLVIIMLPFLLLVGYLISGGLQVMVRFVELFFPFSIIIFLLLILMNVNHFDVENLLPIFHEGWSPVIKSLFVIPYSTLGYESMLILTNFMENPQKAWKAGGIGYAIALGLYMLMVTAVVACLSVEEVTHLQWPVVTFAQQIEFPGAFLERFEILFIVLWTIKIFMTVANYYFYFAVGVSQLTKKWNKYVYYLPVIPLLSLTIYPKDYAMIGNIEKYTGYGGIFLCAGLPLILLGISMLLGRKGEA